MKLPQAGDYASTTLGPGHIERVYYGIITRRDATRCVMCTVRLTTPVKDNRHEIRRVEAEVPVYRSRRYSHD